MRKRAIFPFPPIPGLLKWNKSVARLPIGRIDRYQNAHTHAIHKSDGIITPHNFPVFPILWIEENVAGRNEITGTADHESCPYASDKAFTFDPGDDRENALLHQKIC